VWAIEMVVRDPDGVAIVIVEVPPDHPQRRAAVRHGA
jgi:hypothetical protein